MRIEIVGVYPLEAPEPCHLVEVLIRDHADPLDVGTFTQELPGEPRSNWQVPWDERALSADGTSDLAGRFPRRIESDGAPLRLAFFFHYLDIDRPLLTPAGDLPLPPGRPRPDRLAFMTYDGPD
jgi:hypothetical protein